MISYALRVAMLPGMIAGNLHTAQTAPPPQSSHQTKPAQSRRINQFNNTSRATPISNAKHGTFCTAPAVVAAQFSNIEHELHEVPLEPVAHQSVVLSNQKVLPIAKPVPKNTQPQLSTKSSSCKSSCSIQ